MEASVSTLMTPTMRTILQPNTTSTKAVFFDRDGTLNIERGYIRELDNLALIPGVAQAVKRLNDAGWLCILTTNQTGPARGFYSEEHVVALNQKVVDLLASEGRASLNALYYCPCYARGSVDPYIGEHAWRKPSPGMIEAACHDFPQIDLTQSWVMGDKASDVELAVNAGCHSALVKTGYGQRVLEGAYQSLDHQPTIICDSVIEAVDHLLTL